MQKTSNNLALISLTALFFLMGFITVLNDILIPHLKPIFDLTYFEASLIQFCFFGAYFIMGGVFGNVISRIGYPFGVVLGFVITASGCALFYPAAHLGSYGVFLGALFILASGIVCLQTAGNPFVTLLSRGKEARNLVLVQAFNSLGTTLGPIFGSLLIFSTTKTSDNLSLIDKLADAKSVQMPYLGLAMFSLILALIMYLLKLPNIEKEMPETTTQKSLFSHKHFTFGALGIFFYVGAEVAIGSFLVLSFEKLLDLDAQTSAHYLVYYWGGAMIGRFLGSVLMNKITPNKYLAFNALSSIILIMGAILMGGKVALIALTLVGFFNSIMFPTIFSLATLNLGALTSKASGIISMAIVGGALIPPIQGLLIDIFTKNYIALLYSYIVPLLCYFYILFFALKGHKQKENP
ncbi:sugar MFS transporter [Helicobacter cetorum]|uniref:Glucose/galactose transporter n=1 Tax=Helicobacter cetorum (strain ATCC BAA-429 / MIT 00-7128) TaxID=182217 RepID=I0EPI1_HELC0|nr:sugar MFS transporter [Helicobacter cetorum]AFI04850.1 glucose/galactose transporter [Helicobacter cetorum MIT 00-7128]